MTYSLNRLVRNLADICAERPLQEKWILAPSLRAGMQWLDSVARSGRPVLNFRVKTLRSLALEVAAPLMEERGLGLLRGVQAEVLVDRAFGRMAERRDGYLAGLAASPGLTETLARTVRDLRIAGLTASELEPADFEVPAKGEDVKELMAGYEEALLTAGLADYAGAARLAIERLESDSAALSGSTQLVMPDYLLVELKGLERLFWEAVPEGNRVVIETDRPAQARERDASNAALLSFIAHPAEAPAPPASDGTAGIFRAVGEVNEVREVLRRCVEGGIPFDQVEILHTDAATYVPLIYELCCRLKPEDPAAIPATFYEGVPSSYSRPARALLGWLSWVGGGYPQSALVNMVADGLLRLDGAEARGFGNARLGAILRAVPIGGGGERYFESIDRELLALGRKLEDEDTPAEVEDEEETPERRASHASSLRERIGGLEEIRALVAELLALTPAPGSSQQACLQGAHGFLDRHARSVNEFDRYCGKRLRDDIAELAGCLSDGDITGFDPAAWLAGLPGATSVKGKGPRPGCLHVSNVRAGGHSGRRHTFIIGLDDSRFPGTGRQDPLLLDGERSRISDDLPTGSGRLARDVEEFARLLAGLRGNVTLGYCCRGLGDDREMFASPVVMSAYRILDRRDGDQSSLARWVGDPASFAPSAEERCLDATEWWLCRTTADVEAEGLERAIALSFPNLARGLGAAAARASGTFTEYDGYVPEAGAECDPTCSEGPALSASRLETLARCPLEYFFRHVLRIEPPEEYEIDPAVWLDPAQRGKLLHSAFREFMARLSVRGLSPEFSRDAGLMREVLDEEVALWESRSCPPSAVVFERELQDLRLAAHIFLREEHEHCRDSRPAYFEVSIGLEPDGGGSALDCPDPVEIELPGGLTIWVHGRIDRVDELLTGEGARYTVWDYKTGGTYGYKRDDPFRQGRHVQNALYFALANARLAEVHPGARAVRFGYFFPGVKAHGERIAWEEAELAGAGPILARLCRMIASGCFPFTDKPDDDLTFSDYTPAYGDLAAAAADIRRKLENCENEALRPFRELREYEEAPEVTGE